MAVIAQITDPHMRPPGLLTLGQIDAAGFLAAAVDTIIAKHGEIDAVVVTGDLTDLGESDAYTHAAMLLSRFSVPVIVVPGNHDRTGPMREVFEAYGGLGRSEVEGKMCFAVAAGDATVIALDTSVDGLGEDIHHGTLGEAQLEWLDATLAASGQTLIAMHHPPFEVDISFMDAIGLTDREAFAAIIAEHDNVSRIACGHVHRAIVGEVAGVPALAIPSVAHQVQFSVSAELTPAFVMEPATYAIHLLRDGRATSHIGYVNDFGGPVPYPEKSGHRAYE
ncbi:phosphodiesterase [Acuticoccus mangrovi]|uniref:Phosphodiesterase n=1 Tax=Acuticoccus mangrovi TaxID=2796142 RepID=A0A934IKI7_9HYPH|nr:phosphodiesterase [Acuticoccus mangrovi]MBJ3778339.1 phosphodiesterase [Acuticoccus mangrovi]